MPSLTLSQQDDVCLPVSLPLKSMTELRDWAPDSNDAFDISTISLQPRRRVNAQQPRLMLVHDMAGGYKEDKAIQGNDYSDIYYVQYWHLTDMFNYFSHERVSIPPVNWTNACHRNGVKSLGTFLVEGTNQMHEMEALLHGPPFIDQNDDPMRLWSPFYADKLVAIAKYYGFDGWLFNIECEFFPFPTNPRFKAEELAKFLNYFTRKMHEVIPGSQVIWYDSMTKTGEINWQNQLNTENDLFFQNTDGIFLNYWWNKESPAIAARHAEDLGRSPLDVYTGTDAWNRGTFGGGGFNSYKGTKTASAAGVSSALFGMAWTYEYFDKVDFEKMDRLFWCGGKHSEYPPPPPKDPDHDHDDNSKEADDSDDELLDGHKKGISDTVSVWPAPGTNWFVTTFDRGFGKRFYHRGKKLLLQDWSHLSHQSILPNLNYRDPEVYPVDKNVKFTSSLQTDYGAFIGGTSLVINGQRLSHRESQDLEFELTVPLFKLCLDVSQGCTVKYIYRTLLMDDVKLTISSHFALKTTGNTTAVQFFNSWQLESSLDKEDEFRMTVTTADSAESRCFLLPATEEQTGENDWITKTIDIPAVPEGENALFMNKVEVSVEANTASLAGLTNHVIACLGYLSIIPNAKSSTGLNILTNLTWNNVVKVKQDNLGDKFFGTLSWKGLVSSKQPWKQTDYFIVSYQINSDPATRVFLGTSFCDQYRISGLETMEANTPEVIVEAVDKEGHIGATATISMY